MENSKLNAIVSSIIKVSPSMRILRIKPDDWDFPEFKSGQFNVLGLYGSAPKVPEATKEYKEQKPEKLIKRAYSIASSSTDEYVEYYISLVRSGSLTPRIFNLEIGDRIFMSHKATGLFTLDQIDSDKNIFLFATGTGVAPYMSMLRSDALSRKGKIVVVQGAANSWDLGYSSELKLLASMFPNFTYYPTVTDFEKEASSWSGDTRFFNEIWADKAFADKVGVEPTADNSHVFLCGNPNMVTSMKELLTGQGFTNHTKKEPGQIHAEEF